MPDERTRPRRLGTPFVESLTSMGRRLAESDVRTIYVLLDIYVVEALASGGHPIPRFIPGSLSEAVNGSTTLTSNIVDGLGRGFGIDDLASTTLLATAGELFTRHDFRIFRAWCPLCLAEDGYDQLVWAFLGVSVCVRHGLRLVTHARCGHEHRPWAGGATSMGCAACGHDLCDAETSAAKVDPLSAAYVQVITWLQSGKPITRGGLAAGLRAVMTVDGMTATELMRRTGLSIHTVGALRKGSTAPELSSITAILAHTPYRLEDLLSQGAIEPAARRLYRRPLTADQDLSELERVLRHEALVPRERRRTLADICRQFGRGHGYASQHFPDLVLPWSAAGNRKGGKRRAA